MTSELERLSHRYLCSTLVVLLRLRDLRLVGTSRFERVYQTEMQRLRRLNSETPRTAGGNFYRNQPYRVGETLPRAVISDMLEGHTPTRDALRLLGLRSVDVMHRYAERRGNR